MSERSSEKAQRLRLRFARGPEAASIGHLEMARVWEHALEEAGLALSYSQGNKPQPRLTIAAGLPTGVTSEGELLDVVLARPALASEVPSSVRERLPDGLEALDCREVGMGLPSLPSSVRWADYEVDVPAASSTDVERSVAELLASEELEWEDTRGEKTRYYDLRELVGDVRVEKRCGEVVSMAMRLRCGPEGVGRPDQVVKALGLPEAVRVHRTRLHVAEESPARSAWRRRGRYA
ncbi:MAG: TIGR03936 family radical SAM-associated protein [Dehalococcoidia bacterium]